MAATAPVYRQPRDDADEAALFGVLSEAFGREDPDIAFLTRHYGRDRMRLIESGGKAVAAALLLPFAQWFGGRPVPAVGYNGVATLPECRGSGLGALLMRASLEDLRRQGIALASLFSANNRFYESVGFGNAGTNIRRRLERILLPRLHSGLVPVRVEGGWQAIADALTPLAEARGRHANGLLQRPAMLWEKLLSREPPVTVFKFVPEAGDDASAEGFAVIAYKGLFDTVIVRDLCLLSDDATRAAVSLLGGYGTNPEAIEYPVLPADPLLTCIGLDSLPFVHHMTWMLRIVDLKAAIEGRGYPVHLSEEIGLEVTDPVLPENGGRWTLRAAGGRAKAAPGGDGALKLDISVLAGLYSGYLHPLDPSLRGRVDGPEEARQRLGCLFACPPPHAIDFY